MEEELNKPIHLDTPQYSEATQKLQPKHINTKHRAMMRHFIAGKTNREVAELFGMTEARVSLIKNSPLFREEMAKMEKEVKDEYVQTEGSKVQTDLIRVRMKERAAEAADTLYELMKGAESEAVRQKSAMEILDRTGYKATEKFEGEVVVDASDGLINALNAALAEMREKKEKDGAIPK